MEGKREGMTGVPEITEIERKTENGNREGFTGEYRNYTRSL